MANDNSVDGIENEAVLDAPEKSVRKAKAKADGEKTYKIKINTDPNDPRPVQVAVQGVQYVVERGVEVEVPERIVEVLRNAVEIRYRREKDNTLVPYEHPSYSFSILG